MTAETTCQSFVYKDCLDDTVTVQGSDSVSMLSRVCYTRLLRLNPELEPNIYLFRKETRKFSVKKKLKSTSLHEILQVAWAQQSHASPSDLSFPSAYCDRSAHVSVWMHCCVLSLLAVVLFSATVTRRVTAHTLRLHSLSLLLVAEMLKKVTDKPQSSAAPGGLAPWKHHAAFEELMKISE